MYSLYDIEQNGYAASARHSLSYLARCENILVTPSVEYCVLYPCCVGVFGMFAVMYGRMPFTSVLANVI